MQEPATERRAFVKLRTKQFLDCAAGRGLVSDSEIAGHTGLDRTTVFRLLRGDNSPGERIIATLLLAFPDKRFDDFFEAAVRDEPKVPRRAAA